MRANLEKWGRWWLTLLGVVGFFLVLLLMTSEAAAGGLAQLWIFPVVISIVAMWLQPSKRQRAKREAEATG